MFPTDKKKYIGEQGKRRARACCQKRKKKIARANRLVFFLSRLQKEEQSKERKRIKIKIKIERR
jgi:hypothetical protein